MRPRIALSREFLGAFSDLPRAQQKKVRLFTEKFKHDPTQAGLNFEHISDAIDDKVRSVRIDRAYRAILIHPPRGDVYLLVWVDHHDAAYAWARHRRFEVHPQSGTLQVYDTEVLQAAARSSPGAAAGERAAADASPALFAAFGDDELMTAGVPAPLLPAVRAVATDDDLDRLAPHLPEEAAEMLLSLAAGYSLEEAIEELDRAPAPAPQAIDVEDFGAALERPDSERRFRLVRDEADLDAMLDAPLDQWRIFLHPSQRKLVQARANGPMRVLGGAGTGKTVVLMHRARFLVEEVFTGPGDRILVTTFTRNLALDLESNLRNLCGGHLDRIEVTNLHRWAINFLRAQGQTFTIVPSEERSVLWSEAVGEPGANGLTAGFYKDEWDRVVQPQDVLDRDAYYRARRSGRGTRLSRPERARVWDVMARYRARLVENGWVEWADVIREARRRLETGTDYPPYRAVLADEVQDLTEGDLRLLRALAPRAENDLFLVGDGHQRIYGRPVPLRHVGIDIRGRRSRRLKLNYRTTQHIRSFAVALLEGQEFDDLDGGVDSLRGYCSLRSGAAPEVRHFATVSEEEQFLVDHVRRRLEDVEPHHICIAARSNGRLRSHYMAALERAGIPCVLLQQDPEAESQTDGVRMATMHRLKGLEFPYVILAGVQEGAVPSRASLDAAVDAAGRADAELAERCLLYVAATRARDRLLVTGHGVPSPFVRGSEAPEGARRKAIVRSQDQIGGIAPLSRRFGTGQLRRCGSGHLPGSEVAR